MASLQVRSIPVQVGCDMGRRMSRKYPHISHNKPHKKETIQSHFEVINESLDPTRKMQLRD
jgi:hypothetical protein